MNIEEIKKIVRQEMENSSPSVKEVLKLNDSLKYWANKCKELEKGKKELNTKILSAIEYIDMIQERRKDLSVEEYHNKWCKLFDYYESQCIMLDLLDILKGSDKE